MTTPKKSPARHSARSSEPHRHVTDDDGRILCCSLEEQVYAQAGVQSLVAPGDKSSTPRAGQNPDASNDHGHDHDHADDGAGTAAMFFRAGLSLILLLAALATQHWWRPTWFAGWIVPVVYLCAYAPVGYGVLRSAIQGLMKGEFFSEFVLMSIATIGAFVIGEYPEAVAVMLFYNVGETFQVLAVRRATSNIQALLDQRPDEVTVLRDGAQVRMHAADVQVGDIIHVKPGEKIGLDGLLMSDSVSFNAAALTGESKPLTRSRDQPVLAGMINLNRVAEVRVTTAYTDSKLSKILALVQEAVGRKAPTEAFIRRFARLYTPAVVLAALLICILPFFFLNDYDFTAWLYRALIFLVIACPCALVISIPLGYFGGIGAASRNGILVKGSQFLDILADVRDVFTDKTGTLTEGMFRVHEARFREPFDPADVIRRVNVLERMSTHPVATAIHAYAGAPDPALQVTEAVEVPGHGLHGLVGDVDLAVGNGKLLDRLGIPYDLDLSGFTQTVVLIGYNKRFAGYLLIADKLKPDAPEAVRQLHEMDIEVTMLSGDNSAVVEDVAQTLGIRKAYGDLLPEDKAEKVSHARRPGHKIAFVGDGLNDAPVVALSDVGIAMGGLGSDATIETADVVIQDDSPARIPMAIRIGRQTRRIVWQNISLAFTVKIAVLILGAGGLATLWEAVFADVGVALLAILNAVRIQRMKF